MYVFRESFSQKFKIQRKNDINTEDYLSDLGILVLQFNIASFLQASLSKEITFSLSIVKIPYLTKKYS